LVKNVINLFLNDSEQKVAENGIGILFWSWTQRHGFMNKGKNRNKKWTRIKKKSQRKNKDFQAKLIRPTLLLHRSLPT
jgi:hypothetical protein